MPLTASLSDLRTAIRQRADLVNSQYITDAELNSMINNSMLELYDAVVSRYEDYNLVGPIQFTVSSVPDSGDAYTLPDDFYKLRGLDRQTSGQAGYWDTCRPYNHLERNHHNNAFVAAGAGTLGHFVTWYRILGQELYLLPYNTAPGTYRFWYTPFLAPLVQDTDTVPGYMSGPAWHEYIIVDCVAKAYEKQEDDPSAFLMQKESLLKRIYDIAVNRDEGDIPHVQDVHRVFGGPRIGGSRWGW